MQSKKNWFLRKKDGSEYGPVSINDLLRWSAQCRIVAGNAVSTDREEWIPVEEIPELEMHWMAHRADGKEYGPFALAAAQELFTHNVLPSDAILVNRLTGENKPLNGVIALPGADSPDEDTGKQAVSGQAGEETEEVGKAAGPGMANAGTTTAEATIAEAESVKAEMEGAAEKSTTEDDATEQDAATEITGTNDLADKVDAAERDSAVDVAPLLAQIDILHQELLEARTEAAESGENYLAKIAILEKKLQSAQQAARDAAARLATLEAERQGSKQQAGDDLAELRKQTAFMKKNIAALHTELDEVRGQATLRARIILALGTMLTVIVALAIIRMAGGCSKRNDIGTDTQLASTGNAAAANGDSQPVGGTDAATASDTWPTLRIEGLRVDRKRDHLLIRFDDGAFGSLTNLTPSASVMLKTLAEQLRPSLPNARLVVEGHSDDTPMRPTAAFADNAALATARAETGVAILRREGAQAVAAANPGTPPYPNDTPENRSRNRTLVIKIYRR